MTEDAAPLSIPAQRLPMPALGDMAEAVRLTELLSGAIPEVRTTGVSVRGGATWRHEPDDAEDSILLFVGGEVTYRTRADTFEIGEESIARAPLGWPIEVQASAEGIVHFLWVQKRHRPEDLQEAARFPEHATRPWVHAFRECPAYGEAIKSARTVSRTLLPEDVVPRVAMGTVETTGPDRVAPHRHLMLEQLFLGLVGNDAEVQADDAEVPFGEGTLLRIPLGSNHGASVSDGRRLYYLWMDFFMTREGQVHLRSHTPLEKS